MKNSYSYDPEPVKAWREITDYMAIKECFSRRISKRRQKFFNRMTLTNVLYLGHSRVPWQL